MIRPKSVTPSMEDEQQHRDGDDGHRRRDEDGARGTDDVDVVLAGDDKHVGRDRECCAEQGRCCPERLTSKRRVVVRKRAAGWTASFMNVM